MHGELLGGSEFGLDHWLLEPGQFENPETDLNQLALSFNKSLLSNKEKGGSPNSAG
jgi:hypothetical protein